MKNDTVTEEKGSMVIESNDDQYERCVCCKKITNVLKKTNIELRSFYVEGAGQLCYDCYKELYPDSFL